MPPAPLPKDPRELLGGYATGTLTEHELQYLMSAALEDQDLFDELQDEIALKQALDAPGVRRRLLAKLEEEEPAGTPVVPAIREGEKRGWFRWQWGAVGLAAAALAVLTFVLLEAPTQNIDVAKLETQAGAQVEAAAEPPEAVGAESNEATQEKPRIFVLPSIPIPKAEIPDQGAQVPQAEVQAAEAADRAPERRDAANAEPAAQVLGGLVAPQPLAESAEAKAAEETPELRAATGAGAAPPKQVAAAKRPPPVPAPQPSAPKPVALPPAARARAAADAGQQGVAVADQVSPQLRAAPALEGTTVSQFAAGGAPAGAQNLVFNGQPVLPDLLRRAGATGFAYQIVGRTLVVLPSENGYLTVTEEAAGGNAPAALTAGQPVMSRAPVTIALGAGNTPVTISFARSQDALEVEVQSGEAVTGAVALPAGEDSRVTVTIPR